MPRRSKRTLRALRPYARAVAKLANEAHSVSARLRNLSDALQGVEIELEALRRSGKQQPIKEETWKL